MITRSWLLAVSTAVSMACASLTATAPAHATAPAPATALAPQTARTTAAPPVALHPASAKGRARAPLSCAGDILLAAGDTATQLYDGMTGPGTIDFTPVGAATAKYNGMGVDPDDKYIYAIDRDNLHLLRIDSAGAVTDLGSAGLPTPTTGAKNYAAGAFDGAGSYVVGNGYNNMLYRVDIATKTSTPITLDQTLNGVIDIAYSGGYFWGADLDNDIIRIDPATGTVTSYSGILMGPAVGTGFGGAFTYGNGDLGFYNNGGTIIRVQLDTPATPVLTQLSTQAAPAMSIAVDATSCYDAPVDLGVDKSGPVSVSEGGTVSYTIKVTNNGPNPSSGWTLTDTIPAGLTNAATTTTGCMITNGMLSCTGGPLAVGASSTIALTGTAGPGVTTIVNTAVVAGNDPDPNPDNDQDTTTTIVNPLVDLGIDKSGPASVDAGGNVSYTLKVTNNGPSPSSGWTVTDTIPAGLDNAATTTAGCAVASGTLTCTGGPLAVGASSSIALTGTAAPSATTITNTAKVKGKEPDPNPDNDQDTTTTTVNPVVDLGIDKSGPASVDAGGNVSYTLKVTNNGPSPSSGWTVTDTIPAGLSNAATTTAGCAVASGTLTCTGGPLAVGASSSIALTGTAAPSATTITNTAKVKGKEPDPNPDNDQDTTTTTVNPVVDLGIDKSGPASVDAGGNVSYTLKVTNNGPSPSSGWTVTDTIPAGLSNAATTTAGCAVASGTLTCTGGPLAVGASSSITLTGTAANSPTTITNTAKVKGNEPDPNPDNDQDTVTTTVNGKPGLTIVKKQNGPVTVNPGDKVTYTLTVTNTGTTTYTASAPAVLTDDLSDLLDDAKYDNDAKATSGSVSYQTPTLTWRGALAPGQKATITFSITTNARPFGDLKLDNTVVSATPGNNCPAYGTDPRCTTHGKVKPKDKDDKDRGRRA
ncbi:hypothetical protein [Streptomyces sp. NPDC094049]|uniref:DUF6923 family protein n=1 Tax=Streptomyces sp. NPDC094049 TaxID=3154987 RepID=UPI00331D5FFD